MRTVAAEAPAARGVVTRAERLRGELRLPSDKSVAHRALIADALARADPDADPVVVTVDSPGEDVRSTVRCLRALGTEVSTETSAEGSTRFELRGAWAAAPAGTLDCGNSGTTMRLLAGALAGRPVHTTLDGDASLRRRPMERLAEPLRAMGAKIETTDGHPPISVRGADPLRATDHRLPVASAQLLGAICLGALSAGGETRVLVPGPTRDHTERLLAWMGVPIERHAADGGDGPAATVTTVRGPARPRARSLTVPGDPSAATAWLVAAAIHPDAELRLVGVGLNPTRLAAVEVLREMGADIEVRPEPHREGEPDRSPGDPTAAGWTAMAGRGPETAVIGSGAEPTAPETGPQSRRRSGTAAAGSIGDQTGPGTSLTADRAPGSGGDGSVVDPSRVVGPEPRQAGPEPVGDIVVRSSGRLRAVRVGGPRVAELIDELPLLAVAMAAAEGTSELRDAGELRVKESDRIAAVVAGLAAIGARVEELPGGWRVRSGTPRDAAIETHADHRIAIAFAVAALSGIAGSVQLDDPACVAVSYPTFWHDVAHVTGSAARR